ncbi:MAG TPA: dihydrodipicolinate reductase C-terminal domain-containing protein [Terriglobia bacterium]|nr:dihydrodipicolinate reductase C-terminal domain-containing protein [Terriglobia bacterium]
MSELSINPTHPAIERNLNLALLGYGKMGRTIAQLAPQRGFQVRLVMDIDVNPHGQGITREKFEGIDVCVDFTSPDAVTENVRRVAEAGCNLVIGTTGWSERLAEVGEIVEKNGIGLVHAANFSIGVNLFYRAAQAAAEIFGRFPMYEPYITEAHHRTKKDAPSGTAKEMQRQVAPLLPGREIPVASFRAGFIPGTHELGFDSEADTIILRHTARGRQGFAEGALLAARWVVGKKGLFTFADVLQGEGKKG